jgi:hypothetical protein
MGPKNRKVFGVSLSGIGKRDPGAKSVDLEVHEIENSQFQKTVGKGFCGKIHLQVEDLG